MCRQFELYLILNKLGVALVFIKTASWRLILDAAIKFEMLGSEQVCEFDLKFKIIVIRLQQVM